MVKLKTIAQCEKFWQFCDQFDEACSFQGDICELMGLHGYCAENFHKEKRNELEVGVIEQINKLCGRSGRMALVSLSFVCRLFVDLLAFFMCIVVLSLIITSILLRLSF